MKKTAAKRMLAFLLAFVTILSGIQTFDLRSYAEGIDDTPIVQDAADLSAEVDDQTVTGPVNDAGPLNDAQESETAPDDAESYEAAEGEPAAFIASESAEPIVGTSGEERKVKVSVTFEGVRGNDKFELSELKINGVDFSPEGGKITQSGINDRELAVGNGTAKEDDPEDYYDVISIGHPEFYIMPNDNNTYWIESITINGEEFENESIDSDHDFHSVTSDVIADQFHDESYNIVIHLVKKWYQVRDVDKTDGEFNVVGLKYAETLEDAQAIIAGFYDSHLKNDQNRYYEYADSYSDMKRFIDMWSFRDITAADDVFLDNEGIAQFLHVGFFP